MTDNIIKQPPLPNASQFHTNRNDDMLEVMRISRDSVWVNPDMHVDEEAKAVLDALGYQVKVLVQKAVEEEREACALICDEVANKHHKQHYPDLESVADECAGAIRSRGIDGAKVAEVGIWGEK